jgi:hypothetical protein
MFTQVREWFYIVLHVKHTNFPFSHVNNCSQNTQKFDNYKFILFSLDFATLLSCVSFTFLGGALDQGVVWPAMVILIWADLQKSQESVHIHVFNDAYTVVAEWSKERCYHEASVQSWHKVTSHQVASWWLCGEIQNLCNNIYLDTEEQIETFILNIPHPKTQFHSCGHWFGRQGAILNETVALALYYPKVAKIGQMMIQKVCNYTEICVTSQSTQIWKSGKLLHLIFNLVVPGVQWRDADPAIMFSSSVKPMYIDSMFREGMVMLLWIWRYKWKIVESNR